MLSLLVALAGAAFAGQAPDLILFHGRVFVSPGNFAQAVAISGNRIAEVGDDAHILALRGPRTRALDLSGRAVAPGFHDAHAHLFADALSLGGLDLRGEGSIAGIQRRLARYALERSSAAWIVGRGWEATRLAEGRAPTREDLDAVVSSRPVMLEDLGGRSLWLNSEALKRAGLAALPSATGLLDGDAARAAAASVPRPTDAQLLEALGKALALARQEGVTAVDSLPGTIDVEPEDQLRLWNKVYRSGQATLRFFLYGRLDELDRMDALRKEASALPPTRFALAGLSADLDGTLEARTAALLEPYFDADRAGALRYDASRLQDLTLKAGRRGFQVAFRAVGDKAVRMALDACQALERTARDAGEVLVAYPCRIEGAELVADEDLPRFLALRAAASLQPGRLVHADQEQNFVPERLGDRARRAFALRSLEQAGAIVTFGSDWPALPLAPGFALFAATTRRNLDGKPADGWVPEQRLGLESAIAHYTFDAARALGREEELGQIAVGKLADLVVLDRDVFAASGRDLLDARVDVTIYDGRVVYQRKPR